jgi:hypothetical protein
MRRSPVSILLVPPLHVLFQFVGHLASMVYKYSLQKEDEEIIFLNTSSNWRSNHRIQLLLRSLLFKDLKDLANSTIIIQRVYS